MMLENCCYDFYELTALNMARQGVFGEIYHVEGAYIHNLDPFWDAYQGNWRLEYNQKFDGDNYPTHGIGPVCQVLNIHRGDKMNTLVAMDTKSIRGASLAKEKMGMDEYAEGDHTVSLIRTELGHIVGAGPLPEIFRNLPGPSLAVTAPGFPKIFLAVPTGAPFGVSGVIP